MKSRSAMLGGLAVLVATQMSGAVRADEMRMMQVAAANPCNPCAAKVCNPCNPCAAN